MTSGTALGTLPPPGGSYIAPNPVTGNTAIVAYWMVFPGSVEIRVFNAIGQMVSKHEDVKGSGPQNTALNFTGYAPGVYLYLVTMTYDTGGTDKTPVSKFMVVR